MDIFVFIACESASLSVSLCTRLRGDGDESIRWEPVALSDLSARAAGAPADVVLLEYDTHKPPRPAWLDGVAPPVRTLLMGPRWDGQSVARAIRCGASGCVRLDTPPEMLRRAVRKVHAGEAWFSRQAIFELIRGNPWRPPLAPGLPETGRPAGLTTREDEILQLAGRGLSNKEIGRRLDISDKTVKTHLHRIYTKLDRSGRVKAFLAQPGAPVAPAQDLSWATLPRLSGPAG